MILENVVKKRNVLLVVDEIGPMELDGRGWGPCLDELSQDHEGLQLWVTRNRILERVKQRWNIPEERVLPMENRLLEEHLKQLKNYE